MIVVYLESEAAERFTMPLDELVDYLEIANPGERFTITVDEITEEQFRAIPTTDDEG